MVIRLKRGILLVSYMADILIFIPKIQVPLQIDRIYLWSMAIPFLFLQLLMLLLIRMIMKQLQLTDRMMRISIPGIYIIVL